MFPLEMPQQPQALNAVIEQLINHLSTSVEGTEEYTTALDQLTKLYKVKEIAVNLELKRIETLGKQNDLESTRKQKEDEIHITHMLKDLELELRRKEINANCDLKGAETALKQRETEDYRRVKTETLALVAANIAGIILVIGHERINIITTKALGFIGKLR